jgi:hypothetical protein
MVDRDPRAVEDRVREQFERFLFPDHTTVGPRGATLACSDGPA